MLFGANLMARGETARGLELLWFAQRYLLWMARLIEGTTEHWPTPSKGLEKQISAEAYARHVTCTSGLDEGALWDAYLAAWQWGTEMMPVLSTRLGATLPYGVVTELDRLWTRQAGASPKNRGGLFCH